VSLEQARAVADAVLFEGYALYPYRRSSRKNLSRWQFGVLAPQAFSELDGGDPSWLEAQILVECDGERGISGMLRFLRLRRRQVYAAPGPGEPMRGVDSVEVGGHLLLTWDEGEVHEVTFACPLGQTGESTIELPAAFEEETFSGADSSTVSARVEHVRRPIHGRIRVRSEQLALSRPCFRVAVRVDNETPWQSGGSRDEAMAASMLGAHLMISAPAGRILSLIDPPDWAMAATGECRNVRVFPILLGDPSAPNLALASPIILYDFPAIAPESPGDLFDATEIDEILTLRTRAMTDEEKREARATDPRIAALIDRVDAIPEEALERMHGAFRDPTAGDRPVPKSGDRVRLRPGPRRTDAQDMFLDGMLATVRSVKRDVEGRVCFAVTVDDDPAAELNVAHGRYHYFYMDEVEPIGSLTSS
jgi:hypothetical protein